MIKKKPIGSSGFGKRKRPQARPKKEPNTVEKWKIIQKDPKLTRTYQELYDRAAKQKGWLLTPQEAHQIIEEVWQRHAEGKIE